MKSKLINDGPQRSFAVVFDTGDEVTESLLAFAREQGLSAPEFTGLGAFSDAVLGYFDWQKKDYNRIRIEQQVEVLNLTGNIALADGKPKLHPHIVLGKADGTAHGFVKVLTMPGKDKILGVTIVGEHADAQFPAAMLLPEKTLHGGLFPRHRDEAWLV